MRNRIFSLKCGIRRIEGETPWEAKTLKIPVFSSIQDSLILVTPPVSWDPPNDHRVEGVRKSLQKVRHLSLSLPLAGFSKDSRVRTLVSSRLGLPLPTNYLLDHMFELMPNVVSFSVRSRSPEWTNCAEILSTLRALERAFVKLDFSGTDIGNNVLIDFLDLYSTSLRELRLDDCIMLSRDAWNAIPKCTELRHLSLHNARDLQAVHMEKIVSGVTKLKYLDLRGCTEIRSEGLERIHTLKHIRHLALPYCPNARGIPTTLGEVLTLQHLDLGETEFDTATFHRLATLKNLRTLIADALSTVPTSECFAIICDSFKKLQRLEIGSIERLTDTDGRKLRLLTELTHLELRGAARFSEMAFDKGMGSAEMKTLVLRSNAIKDVSLAHVATWHRRLENLAIVFCDKVTDKGLEDLLRCEPHLQKLELHHCPRITERTLNALVNLCPRLRHLHVNECNTTRLSMSCFKSKRPSVQCCFSSKPCSFPYL